MSFDTSTLKLGRLAAVRPVGLASVTEYAKAGKFPAPPQAFGNINTLQAIKWGMDGNDSLGDCTIAGVDHLLAAWNALFGESDKRPSLKALEAEYKVLSPDDQGCVEATVLETWRTTGLFGNKIARYAPADPRNRTELKQVVAFTGACYLGIACPASAQQQFGEQMQTGQLVPWTYVKGSPIEGGHCIVAVGYTSEGLICVSWGAIVLVTWEFLAKFLEEAWAIISNELAEKGSDTLDLDEAAIDADLNSIAA